MSKDVVRTCVACRAKEDRLKLLRFVRANDGEIVFDEKSILPHRGAWLCPKQKCLIKAFEKKILFRDMPTLPIEKKVMLDHITSRFKKRLLAKFGLMRKMGLCKFGREEIKRLSPRLDRGFIVLASDLAERSKNEILPYVESLDFPNNVFFPPLSMEEIGTSLGRSKTGVVAFLEGRISNELRVDLESLMSLCE